MPRAHNGVTKACKNCGKDFYVPHGRAETGKFCSRDCYATSRYGHTDPVLSFWTKVDKTGHNGCWLYMGFRKWDGYGWVARKQLDGRVRYMTAHRYAWILKHGSEPADGLSLMHTCDNPPCCNPAHLRAGTHAENMADAKRKGRTNSGHHAKRKPKLWPDRVRPTRET